MLFVLIKFQGRNQDLNLAKQKYEILPGHKNLANNFRK
jgi:hypothetical protein